MLNRNVFVTSILVVIKLFLLVNFFSHIAEANLPKQTASSEKVKDLVPDSILYLPLQNPGYALLVEKSTQKAYLYQANRVDHPLKIYHCSTGENKGPKSKKNDKKTPEGVYSITNSFKKKHLSSIYGACAFSVDYPNPRDRKLGRKGYGIWIHGTNQSLKSWDTNGCIVFSNKDIKELSKYIRERHTPIIITQKINFIEKKKLQKERAELKGLIMNWLTAWNQGPIDIYMSFYSKAFTAKEKNWSQWRAYKKRLAKKYGRINITIDNLQILKENEIVLAKFDQFYEGNGFISVGEKRLYLQRNGLEWKITDEFFKKKKEHIQERPELKKEETFSAIKHLIFDWQKSWQEKDLQKYLANYSEDFYSLGLDLNGWKRRKSEINKRCGQIKVTITNLKIKILSSKRAIVNFDQEYSSEIYHDKGKKTIQLINREGKWKIRKEKWVPLGDRKKK
jgi:murein L,D-transpeptidase YafK